ncbi:hypothetical protein [Bartonella tribocorum]|uniref:Uncharacterized protein n=1 Tax=Bartonella tribocorum TaxID=85701 RepID=A0A2M6USL2_9HYPH|nr:hypothetical protein [Bartonella tribocorum]PIT69169.1 hypothetical protein CEV08_06750 [Bartonella tribocorum]
MSTSLIIGRLIGVEITIFIYFIYAAFFSVFFSTMMTILALYYSCIKRTILLWAMWRKLKKGATQDLRHDQAENRGQNTVPATQFSVLSFRESLEFSKKDYSILFSITCVMFVLFIVFIIFAIFLPKSGIFLQNHAPFLLHIGFLVMKLLFQLWTSYIIVALPVILIFHSLLLLWREKAVKKLETFS